MTRHYIIFIFLCIASCRVVSSSVLRQIGFRVTEFIVIGIIIVTTKT